MATEFLHITNLVVHHCISDISNYPHKLICILNIVEKPLEFSLLLQWLQFLKNLVQLPGDQ
jgi:hypothetical protein